MDRHNNFDVLRLVAATTVIFSHAFLLAENSQDHDPLMIITGGQTILGLVGVFMFFTISGYLVAQSFETTRSSIVFLAKRALRIFPGLIVCVLVCAFVIGAAVTRLPLREYLARPETYLFVAHNSILDIYYNRLPGVEFWNGLIGGIVNGPLWSLPCEAMLYLMLFVLGACGRLTLPVVLGLVAIGVGALWVDASKFIGGVFWLLGFFAAGMCCYKLRAVPAFWRRRWALLALAGLALSIPAKLFLVCFPIFGSYLTIWLALTPRLRPLPAARYGDISYGLYIYGWPIEQCVVYASGQTAPWWLVFAISLPVTAAVAFLSWHLVEKRCRWRGRSSAARGMPAAGPAADAAIRRVPAAVAPDASAGCAAASAPTRP
ncbi:MAG: acyltransferase [Alphaproteobacteria bacterium]|nr:acyltransferase [Alphaproteobacteria bacterium]